MPISAYRKFAYRLFRELDNKPRPGTLKTLYMADIQMLPGMYIGTIVLTSVIVSVSSLVGALFVFYYFLHTTLWELLTLGIVGGALGISIGAFPMMTLNKITGKRVKIESTLPFVLAYMATLSSAGMNPVETIKHVALKDFGPITKEFQKIVYREEVLGEDIISALTHIAANTPSETLKDMLIGMTNIIVSGGSLKSYCEQESKSLFDAKRTKLKEFIDSLAAFSEGYVGGVVVSIVMGVIGIIVVGALGLHILFLSTQNIFDLLTFLVVPLVNVLFLAMLEMKFSSGEI